ncbi:MAG: hypothetical protein LIP09_05330 [Bacteroidales bacterium]|nr:hypothetical protein [Bacteroidales bacterium]
MEILKDLFGFAQSLMEEDKMLGLQVLYDCMNYLVDGVCPNHKSQVANAVFHALQNKLDRIRTRAHEKSENTRRAANIRWEKCKSGKKPSKGKAAHLKTMPNPIENNSTPAPPNQKKRKKKSNESGATPQRSLFDGQEALDSQKTLME